MTVINGPNGFSTLAKNVENYIREFELEDSYISYFRHMDESKNDVDTFLSTF